MDFLNFVKLCVDHKVKLVCIKESIDFTSSTGELMARILIQFASWELSMIKQRTRNAILTKISHGQYPYGNTPFGYKKTKDHILYKDNETKFIVEEVIELYQLHGNIKHISKLLIKNIRNQMLLIRKLVVYLKKLYIKDT